MSNELITDKHEWVQQLNSDLDRLGDNLEKLFENPKPTLCGEVYITDKELAAALKVSRRTLQEYRNNGILPYHQLGGKILYKESDVEKVLESNYREAYRLKERL